MKLAGVLTVLVLATVCCGQERSGPFHSVAPLPPTQPATATVVKPHDPSVVAKIESAFEQKLRGLDAADPFVALGACSGVYLNGYGLVFTTGVSLASAPTFGPFTGGYTKEKADAVHKRKLAHLPALKKAMSEMLTGAAKSLTAFPPDEKFVVAVRLFYLDYEDRTGLPTQIVMTADRASALAGIIQTEEQ
jgi:hypothetical protein